MNRYTQLRRCLIAIALVTSVHASRLSALNVLVYDDNNMNHFAATAATAITPTRTLANSSTFNSLLSSQSWDVVLIDCPGVTPGNWQPTINYINGGGKVVMSFWDWDNNSGAGNAGLLPAFGLSGTSTELSLVA